MSQKVTIYKCLSHGSDHILKLKRVVIKYIANQSYFLFVIVVVASTRRKAKTQARLIGFYVFGALGCQRKVAKLCEDKVVSVREEGQPTDTIKTILLIAR